MKVQLNDKIPNFELSNASNEIVKVSDFKGKNLVLYFYPKDNTKGCTLEANEFKALIDEFRQLNTEVIGISQDSVRSHEQFKAKYDLPFDLLADTELEINKMFDVYQKKKMFGNEYMGTVRSTFIINQKGILVKEFRNVKSKGHAQKVLAYIKENL